MTLIAGSIPNLINGVSQQAGPLRQSSQAEVQVNAMSTPVEGLKKRPPLEFVSQLTPSTYADAFLHTINRDSTERYQVIIVDEDLFVYDIDGTEKTVAFPDGKTYLATSTPSESLKAITIADYTFIINKEIEVAMAATVSASNENAGFVFVKQAVDGATYKVTLESTTYSYTEPAGGTVSASSIAAGIATAIGTGPGGNYTVTRSNHVLYIKKNTAGAFNLGTEDDRSGQSLTSFINKVQRFSDLPTVCRNGYIIEVRNDSDNAFDNFYVKFETNDGNTFGEGTWIETVAAGLEIEFDADTMPHILVRESTGDFTFKVATWENRDAGDDETNGNPSFVEAKFNDIFFFKNRLGFLSGDNVILSEAGEFFNFWKTTVATKLDSDPLDISAAHTKVAILYHAVPYSEQLILFSEQTQFVLSSDGILNAENVTIVPTTEFEASTKVKPVGAGPNIYFVSEGSNYASVLEFFVSPDNTTKDASNITSHIPKYIPAGVFKQAVSTKEDLLALISTAEPNTIFVYKYLWAGDQKLQSSWSKWTFGDSCTILNVDFIEDIMYVVTQREDGIFLEKIRVSPRTTDENSTYLTYLDRRITDETTGVSSSYDAGTDVTTWTIPYEVSGTMQIMARYDASPVVPQGTQITVSDATGTSVSARGDWTTQKVFIGQQYSKIYTFSTFFIKEEAPGGGQVAITGGRLQIRFVRITYENTGYFRVEVTPRNRDTLTYIFPGRILGSDNNVLGSIALEDGDFKASVLSKNTEVEISVINDSPLPSNLLSLEWEGFYVQRASRL